MRVVRPDEAPALRAPGGLGLRTRVLAVHIPRGEPVAVTNAGADTLRLIAVFSPAGFERRFLGWDVRERTADRVAVGIRLDGPPPAGSAA